MNQKETLEQQQQYLQDLDQICEDVFKDQTIKLGNMQLSKRAILECGKQKFMKMIKDMKDMRSVQKIQNFQHLLGLNVSKQFMKVIKTVNESSLDFSDRFNIVFMSKLQHFLQQIQHIRFPHLKILNLSHLKLVSIEPLEFLDAPLIQILDISQNKIRSINCLSKCSFKRLEALTFHTICIKQHQMLYRGNYKKLNNYELDSKRTSGNRLEDLRFLMKMQNRNLEKLYVHDPRRIDIRESRFIQLLYNVYHLYIDIKFKKIKENGRYSWKHRGWQQIGD